jgi:hypothetical protein
MKILVVSEKALLSRAIAPVIRPHWPTDNITFVHLVPYANLKFVYPRGLRMHDYPLVSEPVHGLVSWANWVHKPLVLDSNGGLTETFMGPEHFLEADLIVFAGDPDHTSAMAFDVLMAIVFGDERARDCPALYISSLGEPAVKRAFAEMRPFGQACGPVLTYGEMRRYFDWNWNVNALAILGETQRRAGVPGSAPPLSKYAVQLLYALRNVPVMTYGQIIELMHRWPGTGRYAPEKGKWRPTLGRAASSSQILENLVTAGLLDELPGESAGPRDTQESAPTALTLSARGRDLLQLLHPDCEDPDLPFRMDAWCSEGASAKAAIDRYIKTFFGKQLRFLRNHPAERDYL